MLAAIDSTISNAPDAKDTKKLKDASQQFEALMIEQLLKAARPDDGSSGWLGAGDDDQTGQTALDYANQQMATMMAKNGGIGLTKFIQGSVGKSQP